MRGVQVPLQAAHLCPITSLSLCRALVAASAEENWTKASPEFLPWRSVMMVTPFSTMSKPEG